LDALIDVPLKEALHEAGVEPYISGALLETAGPDDPLLEIYTLIRRYEAADWTFVTEWASKRAIKTTGISEHIRNPPCGRNRRCTPPCGRLIQESMSGMPCKGPSK